MRIADIAVSAALAMGVGCTAAEAAQPAASGASPHADWNGYWLMDPGGAPRGAMLMYDPKNAYLEPDPSPGGLGFGPIGGTRLTAVPYKPEYQKRYDEIVERAKKGEATDTVAVGCRPYGMPRVMAGAPYGPEIVVLPELVVMVTDVETRMIYTDGRGHPSGDDANWTWDGHSVGRWEGDTLVVDTVNIYAGNYDQTNPPHSDQIHVVERLRLVDANTLQNEIRVEDPVMLTRPYTVTRIYKRSPVKWPNKAYTNCGPEENVSLEGGAQNVILPSERAGGAPGR